MVGLGEFARPYSVIRGGCGRPCKKRGLGWRGNGGSGRTSETCRQESGWPGRDGFRYPENCWGASVCGPIVVNERNFDYHVAVEAPAAGHHFVDHVFWAGFTS